MQKQNNEIVRTFDSLAQMISSVREKLGLSQSGLAKKCNLAVQEIENIESGQELFLASTVRQKLAKGLKLNLLEIKMYEKALEYANLKGDEKVWDLYCGIGTIGICASKNVKKLYGIVLLVFLKKLKTNFAC